MSRPRAPKTKQRGISVEAAVTYEAGAGMPLVGRGLADHPAQDPGNTQGPRAPGTDDLTYDAADVRRVLAALQRFDRQLRPMGQGDAPAEEAERAVPPSL